MEAGRGVSDASSIPGFRPEDMVCTLLNVRSQRLRPLTSCTASQPTSHQTATASQQPQPSKSGNAERVTASMQERPCLARTARMQPHSTNTSNEAALCSASAASCTTCMPCQPHLPVLGQNTAAGQHQQHVLGIFRHRLLHSLVPHRHAVLQPRGAGWGDARHRSWQPWQVAALWVGWQVG